MDHILSASMQYYNMQVIASLCTLVVKGILFWVIICVGGLWFVLLRRGFVVCKVMGIACIGGWGGYLWSGVYDK